MVLFNKSGKLQLHKPSSLDLLSLIKKSKKISTIDRLWLLKQKKTKSLEYYNITKAYTLISRILWGEISQRHFHEELHYVNLNRSSLSKVIGQHSEVTRIIEALTTLKVIAVNKAYSSGNFSKSYRLSDTYQPDKAVMIDEPYSISASKEAHFSQFRKAVCVAETPLEKWLLDNLKQLRLHDDIDAYADKRTYSKSGGLRYATNIIENIRGFADETTEPHFSRRNKTTRLFHDVINLHRDMRKPCEENNEQAFLRYKGRPLVEVDMVASQPFLMIALYGNDASSKRECDAYYSMWKNGDFYEALRAYDDCAEFTRQEIKNAVVKGALNARNPNTQGKAAKAVWRVIKDAFPLLAQAITDLKTIRDPETYPVLELYDNGNEKTHSQFALCLQSLEARIILDGACESLRKQSIFCYTIHDAIGCQSSNVGAVKRAIKDATFALVGFQPVLS